MFDQAVKCPLTPALAASDSEQIFQVVRSDSSSYNIGPKIQPKFIPWRLFSESGVFLGQFSEGIFLLVLNFSGGISPRVKL